MNSDNDVNKIIEKSLENSQDFVPSDMLLPLNAFEYPVFVKGWSGWNQS